jgi:hypothetical protein
MREGRCCLWSKHWLRASEAGVDLKASSVHEADE